MTLSRELTYTLYRCQPSAVHWAINQLTAVPLSLQSTAHYKKKRIQLFCFFSIKVRHCESRISAAKTTTVAFVVETELIIPATPPQQVAG